MLNESLLKQEMVKYFDMDIDDITAKFSQYANRLYEKNKVMNLTALTEPDDVAIKHFLDSVILLKYFTPNENASLIDIGTGAGFPGIPLKVMRPDLKVTLLDSLKKRLVFLDEVCNELELEGIRTLHARAEDGAKMRDHRERYDIATARAVAGLNMLCEYTLPYVKVGGVFLALKGDVDEELESSKKAIKLLGGKIESVHKYNLYNLSMRSLVIVRKISHTPTKYPRIFSKIQKEPL